MKLSPPEYNIGKSYERYKQELLAWREITDLSKKKQGIAVALSLPENDNTTIREQVFEELSIDELKADDGLEKLITYLDSKLGKDDLEDSLEKFEDFEDFERTDMMSVNEYITKYDNKYNKIMKKGMILPAEILAFKLLRKANITRAEKLLVLTGMDYSDKGTLYNQAKKSLKKFKGDSATSGSISDGVSAIKLEPAFLAENEEALMAAGYRRWNPVRGRGNGRRSGWRNTGVNRFGNNVGNVHFKERPMNPSGVNGQPLTCRACGSYRHLIRNCPDSWENLSKANTVTVIPENQIENRDIHEHAVLFTGYDKVNMTQLEIEARNCAVLDSACTSTVCGRRWMDCFIQSLNDHDKSKLKSSDSAKMFKFGGGTCLKSEGAYEIPAVIAGRNITIKTDVVDSDIPLLLSRTAMKKAQIKMDLENDTAEIFGKEIALNFTSSGHYCVPIDRTEEVEVSSVCAVKLEELSEAERIKTLLKLHRQFAHPPEKRLVILMKDAGIWREEYRQDLQDIVKNCDICKMYSTTPPRPIVAMPMATRFNQKVAMDLKKWNNQWILHIIDMWSRLTVSVFIDRKLSSEVIDKLMVHWIGVFGVMEAILTDNGGEFNSHEMREVASILNVEVCTTAAESPWSNGLCERVHSVTDMMLLKLQAQYPNVAADALLCWANMARNALQMWHGYSSYQLVFGKNPNLPNIMTDNVSALDGYTSSEAFAKHLNVLHASRIAFIQSEADERIRRALRGKVRASEQVFKNGDRVFYKREGMQKWLGPGKVIFQDGKVVFIRHGGVFVRVCPNRIIKAPLQSKQERPFIDNAVESNDFVKNDVKSDACENRSSTKKRSQGIVEILDSSSKCTSDSKSSSPPKVNELIRYREDDADNWSVGTILGRAGKATGRNCNWFNVKLAENGQTLSIDLSAMQWEKLKEDVNLVLIPQAKHQNPECIKAKQVELQKLKEFDTYEEVENVGQDCISTRWVLWQKGDEVRARLVARGFEETTKVPSDSPTIGKSSMRIFLSFAASNKWTVKTTDIKSAFLQSNKLDRDVYLTPPKEAEVDQDNVWKLKRCLYGLSDAARQFYCSVVECLAKLGCKQSSLDPTLFSKYNNSGKLIGILISHIDDFMHAGSCEFDETVIRPLTKRFIPGKLEELQFTYVGFSVSQNDEGIVLNQNAYVDDIVVPSLSPNRAMQKMKDLELLEQTQLRKLAGKLNWIVQGSRPDMAFELIEISMKFKCGRVEDLLRAVKAIRKVSQAKSEVLYPSDIGNPVDWRIIVFTDAAHANLCDGVSSVRAFVVFLVGPENICCPLSWSANKIKRVVRSTIAAETLSLQTGIEEAVYLKKMITEILNVELPVTAVVDNRSLVEALHSTKLVDDKRLRIDISSIKQSIEIGEIDAVKWCPGIKQLANCMTKKGASGYELLEVFQTGRLSVTI